MPTAKKDGTPKKNISGPASATRQSMQPSLTRGFMLVETAEFRGIPHAKNAESTSANGAITTPTCAAVRGFPNVLLSEEGIALCELLSTRGIMKYAHFQRE